MLCGLGDRECEKILSTPPTTIKHPKRSIRCGRMIKSGARTISLQLFFSMSNPTSIIGSLEITYMKPLQKTPDWWQSVGARTGENSFAVSIRLPVAESYISVVKSIVPVTFQAVMILNVFAEEFARNPMQERNPTDCTGGTFLTAPVTGLQTTDSSLFFPIPFVAYMHEYP